MPRRSSRGGVNASSRTPLSFRTQIRRRSRSTRSSSQHDSSSSPDPLDVISDASDNRLSPRRIARRSISPAEADGRHATSSHRSSSVEEEGQTQTERIVEAELDDLTASTEVQEEDEWAVFREDGDQPVPNTGSAPLEQAEATSDIANRPSDPFRLSPRQAVIMLSPTSASSEDRTPVVPTEPSEDLAGIDALAAPIEEAGGVPPETTQPEASAVVVVEESTPEPTRDGAAPTTIQADTLVTEIGDIVVSHEEPVPVEAGTGEEIGAPAKASQLEDASSSAKEVKGSEGEDVDNNPVDEQADTEPRSESSLAVQPENATFVNQGPDATTAIAEPGQEAVENEDGQLVAVQIEDGAREDTQDVEMGNKEDAPSKEGTDDTTNGRPVVEDGENHGATDASHEDLQASTTATPAPTSPVKPDEEGEEELDEDETPGSEDETTHVDDDVDMDQASASIVTPSDTPSKAKSSPKKKPTTSKPKSKSTAKAAVTAAAKKASKQGKNKTKVDDLKGSKSKGSRATPDSIHGTSVSIASAELAREDSPDSTTDRVWCICRKRESEDDEDVTMVGCESCDDWFHPSCVGLSDEQVASLDVYICRSCERSTKQKTVYKKTCKRDGCDKTLGKRESKYCSDLCAYKVMKAFTQSISNKKTLKQISTAFSGYPKPAPVQIVHHDTIEPSVTAHPTSADQLMAAVQKQMTALSSALEIVRKRQEVLRQAIDHAESLAPVVLPVEESRSSKSKRKGGGGPTEDKQCAWDSRLIWTDQEVRAGSGGEHEVCELAKRRCDKHSGWQKTIAISLEVEERQLERQHQVLVEQHEGLTKSAEAMKEGEHIRTVFRERLTAKRRA